MPSRISVSYKGNDARAKSKISSWNFLGLKGKVTDVHLADSYTIDASLSPKELDGAASLLTNSILETSSINKLSTPKKWDWLIEIGFLPGVTDNIGNTTKETLEDGLGKKWKDGQAVYSSQIFFITGKLDIEAVKKIAGSLYNPLIQRARIKSRGEFEKEKGLDIFVPKVSLSKAEDTAEINLNISDEELIKIGKEGIANHDGSRRGPLALDLEYLHAIRDYFLAEGRNATDIELESIAQTWSEHCKHTIFANPMDEIKDGLFKTYIKEATRIIREKKGKRDFCVSVFSDNAGGIEFNDDYYVSHKVETHNSPSALDPFGGAITGIVGVNRDSLGFGMGSKPIANVYGFCLSNPEDTRPLYRDKKLTQMKLSPRRIMDGVIAGVNSGGNCSGIPTAQGFLYFHEGFRGKPSIFAGTVGLIPKKVAGKSSIEKNARAGDLIVMLGGRVGQDGIHGATFSSEGTSEGSPATAVQIGDPITQKKMSDALVREARDKGLYRSITDDGAGGISCSVAEMAKESGGFEVELEKVPLKYPGLEPWKIWISESQERMTLAVPPAKWKVFSKLMESRGVEASVIGTFTKSGRAEVKYHGKEIMNIAMEFLHNGLPKRELETRYYKKTFEEPPIFPEDSPRGKLYSQTSPRRVLGEKTLLSKVTLDMLARQNVASFEFVSKQYDHEVQASSVLKPLQGRGLVNADSAVLRPVLDSKKGIVLTAALFPSYSDIDSYKMAAASIDSAIRQAVAAGAPLDKIALLDNFVWCSSNDPARLRQLKEAVKACFDTAVAYGTPFISGKDSMFNDFKGFDEKGEPILISVPPTLLISAIGVMNDVEKAISMDFKFEGDLVYLLGDTYDELGGSEYFAYLSEKLGKDYRGNNVPAVDAEKNKNLYEKFGKAVEAKLVASTQSVGRGGLMTALAKGAMAGKLGAEISLKEISAPALSPEVTLFSESQGRILVSVAPQNKKKFEEIMKDNPVYLLGKVSKNSIEITDGKEQLLKIKTAAALKSYKSTFHDF